MVKKAIALIAFALSNLFVCLIFGPSVHRTMLQMRTPVQMLVLAEIATLVSVLASGAVAIYVYRLIGGTISRARLRCLKRPILITALVIASLNFLLILALNRDQPNSAPEEEPAPAVEEQPGTLAKR